jgi:hypothetical protein
VYLNQGRYTGISYRLSESVKNGHTVQGLQHTANEGLARIQHICLVTIYVFPETKLGTSLFPKQNYNILSPNFHIHESVSDLYSQDWRQPNRQTDPGNI